jgi:hypothetical protein
MNELIHSDKFKKYELRGSIANLKQAIQSILKGFSSGIGGSIESNRFIFTKNFISSAFYSKLLVASLSDACSKLQLSGIQSDWLAEFHQEVYGMQLALLDLCWPTLEGSSHLLVESSQQFDSNGVSMVHVTKIHRRTLKFLLAASSSIATELPVTIGLIKDEFDPSDSRQEA